MPSYDSTSTVSNSLLSCLLVLLLVGFSTFWPTYTFASDSKTVRIGFYENPPKLYLGVQDKAKGIFPDIIEEIAKAENWQLEWVAGSWQEGLERLESGDIDIMPDVAYSLQRAEKYTFSDEPVFINWGTLYTHAGLQLKSMPELEGKRIAVMRNSIHTDGKEGIKDQLKKFNISCEFIEFSNYQDVFQALQNNLADVGVVNRLFGTTYQPLYDVLPTNIAFNPRHLKFAFPSHGDKTAYLKEKIDQYLAAALPLPDSIINRIIQSYLCGIPFDSHGDNKQVFLTPGEKAWIKAHPRISIGIDPEFAPFEFVDKNGKFSGFASDYIRLLNQRLGLSMELVPGLSWQQVMTGAEQGEIDLLPTVGFSKKRTQFLSYTLPYIGFHRMLFCRSEAPFITNVKDLAHLKVAVQADTSHAAWIQENTSLKPDYYNTLKETIEAVAEGKADVLIGNLAASSYWIRKLNITNVVASAPVSLERQLLHLAVRKDWPELVGILNKGLASISTQEAETIRNRWIAAGYNVGISSRIVWQRISAVVLCSLLVVGLFWQWNNRLKLEVKGRKEAENDLLAAQQGLVKKVAERTRELEENKNYLQSIFNAPNEAIFVHDSSTGAILDVNETMLKMYDVTYEEALKLKTHDFSLNEDAYNEEHAGKMIKLAIHEGPQTFEWLSKKKNGQLFWTEVGLKLTKFNDRSYIIAVVRNIDDKKKAEQVLAAEQERLAVTLRSIADGVITTDTAGNIVLLNKAAEQLTGWSIEEAHGMDSSDVFNISNDKTGAKCDSPVEMILKYGQVPGEHNHVILTTKDGTKMSIADSGAPIRNRDSVIIGVVLVFRDISNEKKMENELQKVKKLESIGVLAGGIAHDFNNLLSAILGNIELASHHVEDNHEASSLLVAAQKASSRAAKLTQQLLTFAKGGVPIKETASLSQLIQDSADFVLHGSHVSCSYDFPADLWLVNVDTGQISQVIQNIIINARQAMHDGGNIEIRCTNVQGTADEVLPNSTDCKFVKIVIRDTGSGIPKNAVDKIFDPYFSSKEKGSGLGLAICHSIISKHEGHITVQSTPGQGTTFTIFLPASNSAVPVITAEKLEEKSTRQATVMVMDDEEFFRNIAMSQLKHLGHKVVLVADGEQAVERYKELWNSAGQVDIIIMDLTIPGGMGGKEAVQEILKINPQAKVIVASGYSTDPIMANYKEYGFSASIPKPFNLKGLKKAIFSVWS